MFNKNKFSVCDIEYDNGYTKDVSNEKLLVLKMWRETKHLGFTLHELLPNPIPDSFHSSKNLNSTQLTANSNGAYSFPVNIYPHTCLKSIRNGWTKLDFSMGTIDTSDSSSIFVFRSDRGAFKETQVGFWTSN